MPWLCLACSSLSPGARCSRVSTLGRSTVPRCRRNTCTVRMVVRLLGRDDTLFDGFLNPAVVDRDAPDRLVAYQVDPQNPHVRGVQTVAVYPGAGACGSHAGLVCLVQLKARQSPRWRFGWRSEGPSKGDRPRFPGPLQRCAGPPPQRPPLRLGGHRSRRQPQPVIPAGRPQTGSMRPPAGPR